MRYMEKKFNYKRYPKHFFAYEHIQPSPEKTGVDMSTPSPGHLATHDALDLRVAIGQIKLSPAKHENIFLFMKALLQMGVILW